jgi:nuclear transport factor 2 (NTF2) superfamily protein
MKERDHDPPATPAFHGGHGVLEVRLVEDACNKRDPVGVALACT